MRCLVTWKVKRDWGGGLEVTWVARDAVEVHMGVLVTWVVTVKGKWDLGGGPEVT